MWTPVSTAAAVAADPVADARDLEALSVLATLVQAHPNGEVVAEDLKPLKSGILDMASESVMDLYGGSGQRGGGAPTNLAILDILDEVSAPDYNGAILFTHPFDSVCASTPGSTA